MAAAIASVMKGSSLAILAMRSSFSSRAASCTLLLLIGLLIGLWIGLWIGWLIGLW